MSLNQRTSKVNSQQQKANINATLQKCSSAKCLTYFLQELKSSPKIQHSQYKKSTSNEQIKRLRSPTQKRSSINLNLIFSIRGNNLRKLKKQGKPYLLKKTNPEDKAVSKKQMQAKKSSCILKQAEKTEKFNSETSILRENISTVTIKATQNTNAVHLKEIKTVQTEFSHETIEVAKKQQQLNKNNLKIQNIFSIMIEKTVQKQQNDLLRILNLQNEVEYYKNNSSFLENELLICSKMVCELKKDIEKLNKQRGEQEEQGNRRQGSQYQQKYQEQNRITIKEVLPEIGEINQEYPKSEACVKSEGIPSRKEINEKPKQIVQACTRLNPDVVRIRHPLLTAENAAKTKQSYSVEVIRIGTSTSPSKRSYCKKNCIDKCDCLSDMIKILN